MRRPAWWKACECEAASQQQADSLSQLQSINSQLEQRRKASKCPSKSLSAASPRSRPPQHLQYGISQGSSNSNVVSEDWYRLHSHDSPRISIIIPSPLFGCLPQAGSGPSRPTGTCSQNFATTDHHDSGRFWTGQLITWDWDEMAEARRVEPHYSRTCGTRPAS